MTQGLQQAIVDHCKRQIVEHGIEISELDYHPTNWDRPKRILVVRQHISRRANVPGRTLSLFKDDEDLMGWRYGAMITDLGLAAIEIWGCPGAEQIVRVVSKSSNMTLDWTAL